jgi:hypothetical protein
MLTRLMRELVSCFSPPPPTAKALRPPSAPLAENRPPVSAFRALGKEAGDFALNESLLALAFYWHFIPGRDSD